jgi:predicted RNA-binding protein YlxR (DUF448 family)
VRERLQCEFSLIRYVPDVVKGEFVNIGVVLRRAGEGAGREDTATVKFTRDWSRVKCMDPDADVELLESLETEITLRLQAGVELRVNAKPMLETLEDSLSNSVQLTEMRGTLAESLPAEMEQLLRMYVEPLKLPSTRRKTSGRGAIVSTMRDTFERASVWRLMRKRISAALYTQVGDPLKIDCGYRNGKVRMFHAVSLENDVEGAKGIAYSAEALRAGVLSSEGVELELTAIVETIATIADQEQYGFGVSVMEREAIRVLTVADLGRVAETARRELRV